MRTLEWIIADNARICAEQNIQHVHLIATIAQHEWEYMFQTYHDCVAKFTCDLHPSPEDKSSEICPEIFKTIEHYNECQLCRIVLLAYRFESQVFKNKG